VSFSELQQEERKLQALQLLRATDCTLDEIADRLGYSTASNFARAFTRWTGHTPAAYRKALPSNGVLVGDGLD
jgi:AraC-like DNA-binding protein